MTGVATRPGARRRLLAWGLCAAMPILGVGYQVAAKSIALDLSGTPFGLSWFARLATRPATAALLAFEAMSFAAWMTVLAEMSLSAAFPITALGYVLVIVAGWALFGEAASVAQVVGGAAILAGVWTIGRAEAATEP